MATRRLSRRGTTAEIAAMTPAEGEIVVDTTLNTASVGNGATPGGHYLAKQNSKRGFSARASGTPSASAGGYSKVPFNVEEYDPAAEYDHITNYRYTPSQAGEYLVSVAAALVSMATDKVVAIAIYKNGAALKQFIGLSNGSGFGPSSGSTLVSMNGTTDYLECYFYNGDVSARNISSSNSFDTLFTAFLTTV